MFTSLPFRAHRLVLRPQTFAILGLSLLIALQGCQTGSQSQRTYHARDYATKPDSARIIAELLVKDLAPITSIRQFDALADSLPTTELFSLSVLDAQLKQLLSNLSTSAQDSLYAAYLPRFFRVVNSHNDSLHSYFAPQIDSMDSPNPQPDRIKFIDFFDYFGMGLYSSEGIYYLDVSPYHFKRLFDATSSDCIRAITAMREKELLEGFSEDAGLVIPFDSVYNRARTWESILQTCNAGPLREIALDSYAIYVTTLLVGMDNTPVFSQQIFSDNVRQLYQGIAASSDSTQTSSLIRQFYGIVEANGFRETDAVSAWIQEHDISFLRGVEPSTH